MPDKPKNITVAIPVYGDWPSLSDCIESIKNYIAPTDKVILLNDQGPEAELMEKNIQAGIKGLKNFEYHTNNANLGFVGTHNRIALEIDKSGNDLLLLNSDTIVYEGAIEEMKAVLYASKNHGSVSPRSNNATICSVPFVHRSNFEIRDDLKYSEKIYQKLKTVLPRLHEIPVAHGYCMLVRRELVDKFGLFDEIYGLGYAEESDFCMRVLEQGYISVMANRAYVAHMESRSFTSEKKQALMERNEKILLSRYPDYNKNVYEYVNYDIDPADWFGDLIFGPLQPSKTLVFIPAKPSVTNFVETASKLKAVSPNSIQITVTSFDIKSLKLFDKAGIRTVYAGDLNELFHTGYALGSVDSIECRLTLNRRCLKILDSEPKQLGKDLLAITKLSSETDITKLRERWAKINSEANQLKPPNSSIAIKSAVKSGLKKNPKLYNTARSVYRRIKR